jgi:poly(hydroxyalkanoate) granule-associated protein
MAKKVAKKKVTKKTATKATSQAHAAGQTTQDIWLAGLGAFALAQDEGSKILKEGAKAIEGTGRRVVGEGAKLFEKLVREGSKVQAVGKKMAEETVEDVKDDVSARVGKVKKGAQANWDRLEKVFEQRVAKALARLGVPTSDEIDRLSAHVAKLNEQVAKLHQSGGAKKSAVSKKAVTKKAASKKTVTKKGPSPKADEVTSTPKQS